MRVIEAKMIAAVLTGSSMKSGNTEVTTRTREDGARITTVYLHGNMIAQNGTTAGWGFRLAGWNTPTTRSRLNALLQGLEVSGRVQGVKGQPHFNGKPIDPHDWFHVS